MLDIFITGLFMSFSNIMMMLLAIPFNLFGFKLHHLLKNDTGALNNITSNLVWANTYGDAGAPEGFYLINVKDVSVPDTWLYRILLSLWKIIKYICDAVVGGNINNTRIISLFKHVNIFGLGLGFNIRTRADAKGTIINNLWLLCTNDVWLKITFVTEDITMFVKYRKTGSYWDLIYRPINIRRLTHYKYAYQKLLTQRIVSSYRANENKTLVVFISGPPNSGKTKMANLVAGSLNGSVTNSYNPIDFNDILAELHDNIKPTDAAPLIVCINEIDEIFRKYVEGTVERHKCFPVETCDRTDWNNHLDDVSDGEYPNTIVILTSNYSLEYINQHYHDSLLRLGRVHEYFAVDAQQGHLTEINEAVIYKTASEIRAELDAKAASCVINIAALENKIINEINNDKKLE